MSVKSLGRLVNFAVHSTVKALGMLAVTMILPSSALARTTLSAMSALRQVMTHYDPPASFYPPITTGY